MMSYRSFLLFLCVAAASARAAIDFTPAVTEYEGEGVVYRKASFKSDDVVVSVGLPFGWTCRGTANRLQLTPASPAFSEGVVEASAIKFGQPLTADSYEDLKRRAIAALPPGSQSPKLINEQESLILGPTPAFLAVIEYTVMGQVFRRSLLFANFRDSQLAFRFSAPKAAFDSLDKAFYRSMLSWDFAPAKTVPNGPITVSK